MRISLVLVVRRHGLIVETVDPHAVMALPSSEGDSMQAILGERGRLSVKFMRVSLADITPNLLARRASASLEGVPVGLILRAYLSNDPEVFDAAGAHGGGLAGRARTHR